MTKIVWSDPAVEELQKIIGYWDQKTKSERYSNRIVENTEAVLKLVQESPKMGAKTKIDSIRMRLILEKFYVFYQIREDLIVIVKFWDTRQNPNKNDLI